MSLWEDFADKLFDSRYEFKGLLGEGSWGEVVRAFDRIRSVELAAKLLKDRGDDEILADRFFRSEFRAMANIEHPNVVRVLDFGQSPEGIRYYTMGIVGGETLSGHVGKLLGKEFESVFEGLCRALWAVHERGCLHCDVKPSNVKLVPRHGKLEPVLMDFGLNMDLSSGSEAQPRGTPIYAAPEMLAGREVDVRADIYSLGMTLLEVLTGELPFKDLSFSSILSAKASDTTIQDCISKAPKRFRDCIARMTSPDPRDRFPSCVAILNAMAVRSDRETELPSPPPVQRHLLHPDLIGREEELRAITQAIDDVKRGKGGCILIEGPRKSGRSRLLEETRYQAQLSGAAVVSTACHPSLFKGSAALSSALRSEIGLRSPEAKSRNWREKLVPELQALLAPRPLVLLIDDIDKLEPSEAKLWCSLAHRAIRQGYLAVSTVRERALPGGSDMDVCLDAFSDQTGFTRLCLGSFETEQVSKLCQSMLGSTDDATDIVSLLMDRTGGNVGSCVELVNSLAQESRLNHRAGRWSMSTTGLSRKRRGTRKRRLGLDRFSRKQRCILLAAAINGPRAPASIVQRTTGLTRREFAEHVLYFEGVGILAWDTVRNHAFLRFPDPSDAAHVVESADPAIVAKLSGKAADVLLSLRSKGQQFDPLLLVDHLSRAGRLDEAFEMATSEGLDHEQYGEGWLAIELLRRAISVSESLPGRDALRIVELHLAIGRMEWARGGTAAALDDSEEALRELGNLAEGASDSQTALSAELHQQAGRCCEVLSEYDAAIDHYRGALALLGGAIDKTRHKQQWLEIENGLGWTQMLAGRYEESEETINKILNREGCGAFPEAVIVALNTSGWLCMYRGHPEKGLKRFEEALSKAIGSSQPPPTQLQSINGAASASCQLGRWTDALSYYREECRLVEAAEGSAGMCRAIGNLAVAEYQIGKLRLAEEHFRSSLALAVEQGVMETYVVGLNNLGALLREQGKQAEALEMLEKARRIARKQRYGRHTLLIEGNTGDLLLRTGDVKRAESLLFKVLQRARKSGYADIIPEAYRRMADVALKLGSSRRFNYYSQRCQEHAERVGDDLELCYLDRIRAHYFVSSGQYDRAEEVFRKVVSSFGLNGAMFEEALTRLDWAKLCLERGKASEAEQLLPGLEDVFDEAGAAAYMEELSNLKDEIVLRTGRSDDISQVLDALEQVRASDDVEAALQSVAHALVLMTGADRGLIVKLNQSGMIQFEASANFDGAPEQHVSISSKILRYVADFQTPLLVDSAMTDPRFLNSSSIRNLQLGSVICGPVFVGNTLHGVLYADSKQPGLFKERRHLPLMRLVAHYVGLFLENMRIRSEGELVEELIACLAHEMRSLLGAVLCSLKMMTMPSGESLSEQVSFATEQIDRLTRLSNETVELIRGKSHPRMLGSERIDVNELIYHAAETLRPMVQESHLSLELELREEVPEINGQSDALLRVLTNLVNNAIKYTSPGGTIRIVSGLRSSVRDQLTSGSSYLYLNRDRDWQGSFASISVIDDGEGMAELECERVFQKYAMAHKARGERRISGSGLGLYICRKIVEQHGGRIWATSQRGEGTVITFTLPIASVQETA